MSTVAGYGQSRSATAIVAFLAVTVAVVFGVLAGTGNAVILFLGAGFLSGIVLVSQPLWLLWLGLLWTLVAAGLLQYFGGVARADWPVYATAAAFWIVAIGSRLSSTSDGIRSHRRGLPGFLIALIVFYLLALANSIYQFDGIIQLLVGIKNYVLFFGLTLALFLGACTFANLQRLALGILVIGLIQLPITLYQHIVVTKIRIQEGGWTVGDNLVEASDSVVGTLGGQMLGGGLDDVLAILAFILFAGVVMAWRQRLVATIAAGTLTICIIVPVLLAETKIIFVFFPLVVFVVGWDHFRRNVHSLVAAVIAIALGIFGGLLVYYQMHWSKQYPSFEVALEKSASYSFAKHIGSERARRGDMTRREAVEYWWDTHGIARPDTLFFGHGLASSKLYSTVVLPRTVRENGGRYLGKTGLSQLLWDTGLIGTVLFFGALLAAAREASRLARVVDGVDRVILTATQVGCLLIGLNLLYRNSVLVSAQAGFLLFLMLGIVSLYWKRAPGKVQSPEVRGAEE